ncbi:MAG: purine-binding chemotaxis protein CheW [Cyanobacteria bacterium Co-bin13]|nr:purine-binding chemotaxis protein CheW [Cyanobacteria bacterium Co-bin13]
MNTTSLTLRRETAQGTLAPALLGQSGNTHLKFHLGLQTPAVMPTRHIQEAITIPAQRVSPMPNMPPCMLGLINRRSRVVWVADLALLLGLPVAQALSHQYNLILMQVGAVSLAMRVHEIDGILSISPEMIQAPPAHIPKTLIPYLRGCILQPAEVLLALNAEAIVQSSALQFH